MQGADRLIELLIQNRGEYGCDIAVKKIYENFGITNLDQLSDVQIQKLIDKEEKKSPDVIPCPCGATAYRKGMFYICNKCHKVVK